MTPERNETGTAWRPSTESELSRIGWTCDTRPAPRVDLDAAGDSQWSVARLWTTPGRFQAAPFPAGSMWAFLGVDGVGTVTNGATESRIRPQELLVVPGDQPTESSASAPWARIIWRFETRLLRQASFDSLLGRVHSLNDAHFNLLTAMTGAIALAPASAWDASAAYVDYALASSIAAALADAAGPVHRQLAKDRTGHLRDAIRLIDDKYLDPTVKVEDIARELAMSLSYLHRLFAEVGTTPARELERRRAQRAFALLSSVQSPTAAALEDAAHRSGFSSVRRMRYTMRREDQRPQH